jgi:hypothetical protein
MDLSKILSIGGKPGLYKMVGQTKTGFVVESLADGKRMPAFPSQQVSALEEISIYTTGEDMPLKEVFRKIFDQEEGKEAPSHKADKAVIEEYFVTILPEYDREMVRDSDMRKVFKWYNELLKGGLLEFTNAEEKEQEAGEENETPPGEELPSDNETAENE